MQTLAILLLGAHLAVESIWPQIPDGRGHEKISAIARATLFLGVAGLLVVPLTALGSLVGLAALAVLREAGRWFLTARSGWFRNEPLTYHLTLVPLHLLLLLAWLAIFGPRLANNSVQSIGERLLVHKPGGQLFLTTVGLLVVVGAGTAWIRSLLRQVGHEPKEADEYQVGRYIGNLERILIFFLATAGSYEAIGFVLAAKSLARFKELDEKEFSEYYLLGTLTSTLVALGSAGLVGMATELLYPL